MKNLNQAYRASQKRNSGTYDSDHMDSGIGHSDLDEEREGRMPSATLSDIPESTYSPYQATYSAQHAQHAQQRVPSIQNMLQQYSGSNPHLQQH